MLISFAIDHELRCLPRWIERDFRWLDRAVGGTHQMLRQSRRAKVSSVAWLAAALLSSKGGGNLIYLRDISNTMSDMVQALPMPCVLCGPGVVFVSLIGSRMTALDHFP